MGSKSLLLALALLGLGACHTLYPCPPLYHRPGMHFVGLFEGTLPCADCDGIKTELALWSRGPYDYTVAWYRISETYLGRPETENNFIHEGPWHLERGSGDHPDDTVYALVGRDGRTIAFAVDDPETLTLLNPSDHRRNRSQLNYSLRRVDLNRERCFANHTCARRCCSSGR